MLRELCVQKEMSQAIQKPDNQHYETTTICLLRFDSYEFPTHRCPRFSAVKLQNKATTYSQKLCVLYENTL